MSRPSGIMKRYPAYVPKPYRAQLQRLSKASLMEIAWDFAVRTVGEDQGDGPAYREIRATHRILAATQGYKPTNLPDFAD